MQYLTGWDISIGSIDTYILRDHHLEITHEVDERFIVIGCKSSVFPNICKLSLIRDHHGVDFEFVWSEKLVLKTFLHRSFVEFRSAPQEIGHHMCYDLKTCIFEHLGCSDRFKISMSTFIESVDFIIGGLVSYLDSSHSKISKSHDFFGSDPVRTGFDSHPDDTTFCRLVSLYCFFKGF